MGLLDVMLSESQMKRAELRQLRSIGSEVARAGNQSAQEMSRAVNQMSMDITRSLSRWGEMNAKLLVSGFSVLAVKLEAQSELLVSIVDVLANPEKTRARERRARGEEAYRKGLLTGEHRWFEDATGEFASALELDPFDHVPHMYLGTIAALEDVDDGRADYEFGEAAHYSWPDAPTAAATALSWRSLIASAGDRYEDAVSFSTEACRRAPSLAIAWITRASAHLRVGGNLELEATVREALEVDGGLAPHFEEDPALSASPIVVGVLEAWARPADARASVASCIDALDAWDDWIERLIECYHKVVELPGFTEELFSLRDEAEALRDSAQRLTDRLDSSSSLVDVAAIRVEAENADREAAALLPGLRETLELCSDGLGKRYRHRAKLLDALDEAGIRCV